MHVYCCLNCENMWFALLAFWKNSKDFFFNLLLEVKYGNLLLNAIMLLTTGVLSSVTVSVYLGYSVVYSSTLSVLGGQI